MKTVDLRKVEVVLSSILSEDSYLQSEIEQKIDAFRKSILDSFTRALIYLPEFSKVLLSSGLKDDGSSLLFDKIES